MASPGMTSVSNQTRSKRRVQMELFSEAKAHWDAPHRQVFCQHDKDTVVLFRACCEHLGPHATDTQCLRGSPCYEKDRTRMMWFDTSFLVSMRKSHWGTKKGREVVLAIWVKRSFIEDCLGTAVCSNTFGPCCNGGGGIKGGKGGGDSGSSGGNSRRSRFSASSLPASGGPGNGSRSPGSACSSPANSTAGSPPESPAIGRLDHKQLDAAFARSAGRRRAEGAVSGGGDGDEVGRAPSAATAAAALLARGRHALEWEDSDFLGGEGGEEVRARALTGGASMQSHFGGGERAAAAEGIPGGGVDEGALGRTASEGGVSAGGAAERRPRSQSLTWSPHNRRMTEGVRVHWEPERLPSGEKHRTRRVVQLGLKGKWLQTLGSGDAVVRIERLDSVLAEQRAALNSSAPQLLTVPVARPLDVGHLQDNQLAALHLVSDRARPKLRILCLHGYLQNSRIFSRRTRQLYKKLKNTAELVYVDAPHLLSPEELPPPLPPVVSPLEEAAIAAAAAAAVAAAKVVDAGEGGAWDAERVTPIASPVTSPTFGRKTVKTDNSKGGAGSGTGGPNERQQQQQQQQQDRVGARTWWRCDAEERKRAKAVPGMAGRCEWKGLEESLAFLRKVWDEQGPFDGLLGFSQGAAMASIFNHCVFSGGGSADACCTNSGPESDAVDERAKPLADVSGGDGEGFERPLLPPPKFGVFISGCYQPHPTQIPSYPLTQEQPQAKLASLHVWAVEDRFVPASQSQRLAGMYLRSTVFMHRGSHCVPQNKDIVPNFIRFLEEYR